MRVFQDLVGADNDADDLLEFAYPLASSRVNDDTRMKFNSSK